MTTAWLLDQARWTAAGAVVLLGLLPLALWTAVAERAGLELGWRTIARKLGRGAEPA